MRKLARSSASNPVAAVAARQAVRNVDRTAPLDANALAACYWVRDWIRYARELPETMADIGALSAIPVGDCDDMVIALAALLWRLGYGWPKQRFAIGWEGPYPAHVWLEFQAQDGRWIALDPTGFVARQWGIFVEPGQSPAGYFSRTTLHPLR